MKKVIFDTNIIRNVDINNFLGGRSELEKFMEVSEIIIPDIVLEEIKNQKRINLRSKKTSFMDNPFHWLIGLNKDETKSFDIEDYLNKSIENEIIKYQVIKISNYDIFSEILKLAINNEPPFEENSDKGFKDCYIYFSILEYLQSIPDKNIFVCCKDGRLTEALNKHPEIIVIKNYEDFFKHTIGKYQSSYFLEKLKSEMNLNIQKEDIVEFWVNINDNEVIKIVLDDEIYVVEFDSGEIISNGNTNSYLPYIDSFINSTSFSATHSIVDILNLYVHFFTDNEIINLLQAVKDNNQISWIISDDDIKQFVTTLYDGKKSILPLELENSIKKMLE